MFPVQPFIKTMNIDMVEGAAVHVSCGLIEGELCQSARWSNHSTKAAVASPFLPRLGPTCLCEDTFEGSM